MLTAPNRPEKLYNKQIIDRSCQHGFVIDALTMQQEFEGRAGQKFADLDEEIDLLTLRRGEMKVWKKDKR